MLLAGDVGGTKTLLGLFATAAASGRRGRQSRSASSSRSTTTASRTMIREFLRAQSVEARAIEAACFGVAGAVTDQVARLTNVPWLRGQRAASRKRWASGARRSSTISRRWRTRSPCSNPDELAVLQQGVALPTGNAAVIAAGTGLGEALLHNVDGRFVPGASEGGHADFAARTPREMEMVTELTRIFGRVGVEHVISGPGLVNIYQFTHERSAAGPMITPNSIAPSRLCDGVGIVKDPADLPAAHQPDARIERRCPQCVEALEMFVAAYGAEAGNLALRYVATAGVYVGGGIAPKILPALEEGGFLDGVPRQGADDPSRRDDSHRRHPELRRGSPRRRGSAADLTFNEVS